MAGILRKWWVWVLGGAYVAAATTVVLILLPKLAYRITVSPETTYLAGPLNADGTVNYVAALDAEYSQGVTPENNAAVPLLQAGGIDLAPYLRGPDERLPGQLWRLFDKLGMAPLPADGEYFVSFEDYLLANPPEELAMARLADLFEQGRRRLLGATRDTWSHTEDYPSVAAWLDANERPLALLLEAARRPRYYFPLLSPADPPKMSDLIPPELARCRDMAGALVARAMRKAGSGNPAGALSDLLAVHRLARLIGQHPSLNARLWAMGIDSLACRGDRVLATSGALPPALARAFLAELWVLGSPAGPVEAVDRWQRFVRLDSIAVIRREGVGKAFAPLIGPEACAKLADVRVNWDRCLRTFNSWFDRAVACMRRQSFADRSKARKAFEEDLTSYRVDAAMSARSPWRMITGGDADDSFDVFFRRDPAACLLAHFFPHALPYTRELHDAARADLELTLVAVALAAYRAERGRYPAALAELTPEYLKQLPRDLFVERPLRYRREAAGYVLYSVGRDMRDDGGDEAKDIVVQAGGRRKQ